MKIGYANMQDYIEDDNTIKDLSQLERDKLAAVESVNTIVQITSNKNGDREYETRNVKFKLHSKLSALEKLGMHLGIFEKHNVQQQQNLADFLKAMKKG